MYRTFIFTSLFVSVLASAQIIGPKASFNQTEYNFGNIEQGKVVVYNFVLTNTGGDLLKIENVSASCGCTVAKPEKNSLAPGESTKLKVEFNSTGRIGRQEKYVYIKTNEKGNSDLKLAIIGNVITAPQKNESAAAAAEISFKEDKFDFGQVAEGKVVEHTFSFQNTGKAVLEIKDIKTSCGCTAALVSSKKIEPGKSGTIRVELDTANRFGKLIRTVSVTTNDPEDSIKILTLYAEVMKESK